MRKKKLQTASNPRATRVLESGLHPLNSAREGCALPKVKESRLNLLSYSLEIRLRLEGFLQATGPV